MATLKLRRENRKLSLFFNIRNGKTPEYLQNLLPPTVSNTSHYNLRNSEDYRIPKYRLQLTKSSFIPNTCEFWNTLPQQVKDSDTLRFKNNLQKQFVVSNLDNLFCYNYGSRKANILHCRLRNRCSALNSDLCYAHLVPSPACKCGFPCEDTSHYFLQMP